jgi:transcription termination/antitermination protein NusG
MPKDKKKEKKTIEEPAADAATDTVDAVDTADVVDTVDAADTPDPVAEKPETKESEETAEKAAAVEGAVEKTEETAAEEAAAEEEVTKVPEGVIELGSNPGPDAHWYVVHTYSGHETKVAKTLKQRSEIGGFLDRIFKIYVPQQQKIVVSEGKKRSVDEKLFPGYVMVQMTLDDDSWHVVRSTPGVTGFVGMGSTPTPLPESEVKALMRFTKMEAPKFEAKYTLGDSVKVNDGPFKDFLGKVDEVNEDQGKVKVMVSVFGRETPLELDFAQVSRI